MWGNWAGNLFGNAKRFLHFFTVGLVKGGMADGAVAGANGVKSFINNIISPAETGDNYGAGAAAPTALPHREPP